MQLYDHGKVSGMYLYDYFYQNQKHLTEEGRQMFIKAFKIVYQSAKDWQHGDDLLFMYLWNSDLTEEDVIKVLNTVGRIAKLWHFS
jgi:hypothetical protein